MKGEDEKRAGYTRVTPSLDKMLRVEFYLGFYIFNLSYRIGAALMVGLRSEV